MTDTLSSYQDGLTQAPHLPVVATATPGLVEKLDGPRILGGRFELIKGMDLGEHQWVYRALDRRRLKITDQDPSTTLFFLPAAVTEAQAALSELLAISGTWQTLSHPGLVKTLQLYRNEDGVYITAEYLQGSLLAQRLRTEDSETALAGSKGLRLIRKLGEVLTATHAQGMTHGRLSTQGVWITQTDEPMIFDPGLTDIIRAGNASPSPGTLPVGFSVCSSPELIRQGQLNAKADVYSLACIAYQILTGKHPFHGLTADEAERLKCKVKHAAALTVRQWNAFKHALAFDPDARTATIAEFIDQLSEPTRRAHAYLSHYGAVATAIVVTTAIWFTVLETRNPVREAMPMQPSDNLPLAENTFVEDIVSANNATQTADPKRRDRKVPRHSVGNESPPNVFGVAATKNQVRMVPVKAAPAPHAEPPAETATVPSETTTSAELPATNESEIPRHLLISRVASDSTIAD